MSAAPLATDSLHAWAEKIAPTLSTEEWHGIVTGRPRNMGTFTDLDAGIKAIASECWRVHPNSPQRKVLLEYLDATWAGLTVTRRGQMQSMEDCDSVSWQRHRYLNVVLVRDGLAYRFIGADTREHWAALSPLGQAVLDRAAVMPDDEPDDRDGDGPYWPESEGEGG